MRMRPLARAGLIAGAVLAATTGFVGLAQAYAVTAPVTASTSASPMARTLSTPVTTEARARSVAAFRADTSLCSCCPPDSACCLAAVDCCRDCCAGADCC
jgi:hypothetical protein